MREEEHEGNASREQDQLAKKAFFGRRHGKKIRPTQQHLLQHLLPNLRLDLSQAAPVNVCDLFSNHVTNVRLEIGFGGGEYLLHHMQCRPQTGFIGVEPFVNGMAKLLAQLESFEQFPKIKMQFLDKDGDENKRLKQESDLIKLHSALDGSNDVVTIDRETGGNPEGEGGFHRQLRLYDDDAVRLLDWLPAGSLEGVDLFYPDPWPKKKHWKRRFINRDNLDRIARVLRPGGVLRFASDIDSYIEWTLWHCHAHAAFSLYLEQARDCRTPYPDWPGTRYEKKALHEGRRPAYLTFRRV